MSYRYSLDQPVRWKDIDSLGILNNAVYFTLVEQARYGYFTHLELMAGDHFPFLLGETACRFLRPARVHMELRVTARVTRLGNKSFDMEFEVRCQDALYAQATATLVWIDDRGKSVPIPATARSVIAEFEGLD